MESTMADLQAEVEKKRAESAQQTTQVQQLTSIVERLTRTLDEVAGFKREAITVLGGNIEQGRRAQEDAEREVAILRADVAKKSAELVALDKVRERLENDLENLRAELEREKNRGGLLRRGLPRLG
jgi:chromosome segregation ATPase